MSTLFWLAGAAVMTVAATRTWSERRRYRMVVEHWCGLAEATGAYVFVPSKAARWDGIWLRHKRVPFVVRVELRKNDRGLAMIQMSSEMVFGSSTARFSVGADTDRTLLGEDTRHLLSAADDELISAHSDIDSIIVSDRKLLLTTHLGPQASAQAIERCLNVIYAIVGSDHRGIEAMKSLPRADANALDDCTGDYPRVVVAAPTPVELSIRTDHNVARTVATATASRLGSDFSCDIGANGAVQGRPAELIPAAAHAALPKLAMCRLRKRGSRVELCWPRIESDRESLLAGAHLVASFQQPSSPYR